MKLFNCILFVLFFLNVYNCQTTTPIPYGTPTPPGCIYKNGIQQYDISKLANTTKNGYLSELFTPNRVDYEFEIVFNFCGYFVNSKCPSSYNITSCQFILSGNFTNHFYILGNNTLGEYVKYHDIGSGMTITYKNYGAVGCGPDSLRITDLILNCNPNEEFKIISNNNESVLCDYAITMETKYVCSKCSQKCVYGKCNVTTAKCDCITQATGDTCSTPTIYISAVNSTTTEGGIATIYGYFGDVSLLDFKTNITVLIGTQSCKVETATSNNITCSIGPGSGVKDVTVTSYGPSTIYKQSFQYIEIIKQCPNNCTSPSNGKCATKTGLCSCIGDFYGNDCGQLKPGTPPDVSLNDTTGQVGIGYEDINYNINIISLVEIDINGTTINEYSLNNNWNITVNKTDTSNNNSINTNNSTNRINHFIQNIQSKNNENLNFTIEYIVEEIIGVKKEYSFADVDFVLEPGSIKISISIKNYIFSNILNTLQLRIQSSINETKESINTCNKNNGNATINTNNINNNQLLNYISIVKDHRVFNARFINKLISDSRVTFMSTTLLKQDNSSILLGLNLPHCITECLIDPDFSLLVTPEYKETCDKRGRWFLPVVITVPCVGVVAIILVGALLYRKHRTSVLVLKKKIFLKSLSKKRKDDLYMPNDRTIG